MHSISWDWKTSLSEDKINGVNYRDKTRRNSVPVCRKHETGVEVHITTEQQPCQTSLEYVGMAKSKILETDWEFMARCSHPANPTGLVPKRMGKTIWIYICKSIYRHILYWHIETYPRSLAAVFEAKKLPRGLSVQSANHLLKTTIYTAMFIHLSRGWVSKRAMQKVNVSVVSRWDYLSRQQG